MGKQCRDSLAGQQGRLGRKLVMPTGVRQQTGGIELLALGYGQSFLAGTREHGLIESFVSVLRQPDCEGSRQWRRVWYCV